MFGFSTAYNFAPAEWKPSLRRLDHVGIFLMIAATYTPFTAYLLSGTWAWSLTTCLWILAGLGIVGKIFLPPISQKIWVPIYLGLAWIGAVFGLLCCAHDSSGTGMDTNYARRLKLVLLSKLLRVRLPPAASLICGSVNAGLNPQDD